MSINKITYLDQLYNNGIFSISDPYIEILKYSDSLEITKLLWSLEIDTIYVASFSLVPSWTDGDDENPYITLSKPILITKNSRSSTISNHIKDKMKLSIDSFYLDADISYEVIVRYKEIKLF